MFSIIVYGLNILVTYFCKNTFFRLYLIRNFCFYVTSRNKLFNKIIFLANKDKTVFNNSMAKSSLNKTFKIIDKVMCKNESDLNTKKGCFKPFGKCVEKGCPLPTDLLCRQRGNINVSKIDLWVTWHYKIYCFIIY